MQDLHGKVVAITGASSGIGEATARRLADAGCRVAVCARRVERLDTLTAEIRAAGGRALGFGVDVTDRAAVAAFVAETEAKFGPIDVMINNAGVMPLSPLESLKVDEWDRMIDVNIKGVLYGIAAVLPSMNARGKGHIINIASIGAYSVSPTAAVYCATKFAVRAISDGLRQETRTVRVTTISPGTTTSELAESITDATARQAMVEWRKICIDADAVARAIEYAVCQPGDVDVSEIVVRPTASFH